MFALLISLILTMPLILNPMALGMMIISLITFMTLIMSFYISSWYSYTLFLIYVGGVLVMFMYIATLTPNVIFKKPLMPFLLFFMLSTMPFMEKTLTQTNMKEWFLLEAPHFILQTPEHLAFLGLLLLLILIMVVKTAKKTGGTLHSWK